MKKKIIEAKNVAIIGLGYVGLPIAIAFSSHRNIIGYDSNVIRIDELRKGLDRTKECTPEKLKSAINLTLTSDESLLSNCDTFIITVPTPIDDANKPDLSFLISASKTVGRYVQPGSLIIYESTVFPGATEDICVPIIESVSGLLYKKDFFCGYSPERINPGDKINTLKNTTKVVSGSDKETLDVINDLYLEIVDNTWKASSIIVAEASKVIENTQRDLNIAFVNELSVIFERLGIDTGDVLKAASTKWNFLAFQPGMVGGHCISVDPYYLTYRAEQSGYIPQIILSGRRMNDNMARYAARNIIKRMSKLGTKISGAKALVLGFSFKENCPDIRNSKIFDLINEFKSWGVNVDAYDPVADINDKKILNNFKLNPDFFKERNLYDAIIVAVAHDEFKSISLKKLYNISKGNKVVLGDLKSIYDKEKAQSFGFEVFRL